MRLVLFFVIALSTLRAALAAPPATQPARWMIEARFVERAGPTTQPVAAPKGDLNEVVVGGLDQAALLSPAAKVLSTIEALAIDRQPFSASTTIADRQVHLKGSARKAGDDFVRLELNVGDCTLPPASSCHTVTSNIMLTPGQTLLLGGLIHAAGVRQSAIVVTLKPYDG